MLAGAPLSLAASVVVPPTPSEVPIDWVMAPPRAVTSALPTVVRSPSVTLPVVLVRLTAPAEISAKDNGPCAWVIVTGPGLMVIWPAVWLNAVVTVKLPVPPTVPPLCAYFARLRAVATFSVPLSMVKPPELRLLRLTGPGTLELKTTLSPGGTMTFATLERSGIAPPAQLAGFDQLPPVAGPIQITEAS